MEVSNVPLVKLENFSKKYESSDKLVLDAINLEINDGEFFVIVGPSGSGKSSLIRMVAGLENITDGFLRINSEVVNHLPPKNRNLSMVFQNYALYPHLTVKQNILFGLEAKKVGKEEQKNRLEDAAKMVDLTEYLNRKPRELSGGQRQRVALARAIVSQAPLCLMDEPLSNLDAKLRQQMRMEISQLQKKLGLTLIYITHDQTEAMTMGDRIMVLNDGKAQQIDDPLTLYNRPQNLFVATFIGSPKMNVADAIISNNKIKIGESLEFDLRLISNVQDLPENLKIGIRPESLLYAADIIEEYIKLELEVANVEQLGNATQVSFKVGNEFWNARWSGQWRIEIGDKMPIMININSIYLFDAQTGATVRYANTQDRNGVNN